ncbi:MAG TPA: ricin-type beta-trefoil lectin domain protein [Streptosporangiaceae bacterium]
MRLVRSAALRRAGGIAAVAGLSVLGMAVLPETAAPAATLAGPPRIDRFNVGAPHSPELLRALAGPPGPTSLAHPARSISPSPGVTPAAAAVRGVDVASYQHVNGAAIGWSSVARAGYKFVAIKATEGNYYANPYGGSDLTGAERAGLSVIAYHFAIPNVSGGAAQADYVIANAADGSGRVAPIGLDIEYDPYSATDGTNECYGLSPGAMTAWAAAFSSEVRRRTGRLPILYTTADWWNTCAASGAVGQDPLWVAAYTTGGGPPLPIGWGTWAIWQYTSGGSVPGIATSGNTDLDVFNGRAVPVFNPGNQATRVNTAVRPVTAAMFTVGGSAPPAYSATGLPPGLTVSARTGAITGTPTVAGLYHVRVSATAGGLAGSASFTWTVSQVFPTSTSGAVRLDLAGMCLDDRGNSSADGTTIQIWSCNGAGAQNWSIAGGTIQVHGRCLATAGAGTASRTMAVLAACTGATSQQWQVGTGAALVNVGSGMCLDDPYSSTGNGTALWIFACHGAPNQKWTLPAGPVLSAISGLCLDDWNGNLTPGNKVEIWPCNGYPAQRWVVQADGTVRTGGWCLDVYHGGTALGSRVDLFSCNGTAAQQWHVLAGSSAVKLQNPKSGKCLSDPNDSTAYGTGLVLGSCASTGPGTAWLIR